MEDQVFNNRLSDFAATNTGTNAGVSATQAAATNEQLICTTIAASGDAAALVTIESPSGTVLWRKRFAAAFNMSEHFTHPCVKGAVGQALICKVSASTTNSEANIGGFAVGT